MTSELDEVFDPPPDRELPADVREALRERAMARQGPGRAGAAEVVLMTASAAAAVIALVATIAVLAAASGAGAPVAARPPGSEVLTPEVLGLTPEERYDVLTAEAPAGATERCSAAAARPGGAALGDPGQWRPLVSAAARGVTVVAYGAGSERIFCELTGTTVTLSAAAAGSGGAGSPEVSFLSPLGTAAGVVPAGTAPVMLTGGAVPYLDAAAVVVGDVFVLPNAIPAGAVELLVRSGELPAANPPTERVRATSVPAPSVPTTTDVALPPGDRTGEEGRRLGSCLDAAVNPPVADPAQWTAGATTILADGGRVQLGRHGELLVVCELDATGRPTAVRVAEGQAGGYFGEVGGRGDATAAAAVVFTDFTPDAGGGSSSDTVVLASLVAAEVDTVTLTRPGLPAITSQVVGGTYLLPGVGLNEGSPEARAATTLVLADAAGAVVETVPVTL